MKRILIPKMECTELEIERYKECQKDFGVHGRLYYITEWCPGAGYEIVYSMYQMKEGDLFNKSTMRIITDVDNMLENF